MAALNNKKEVGKPPKTADRFLEWFCKDEWLEPLQGDLEEQYEIDRSRFSVLKSNALYWRNIINLLRPFVWKRKHFNSNYAIMFQNVLKLFSRQIKRNPSQNLISIIGLCIGFCVVFLTVLWINYQLSFDRFHSHLENIYEVKTNSTGSDGVIQTSSGAIFEVFEEAQAKIPEIQDVTRIISNWRWPSEQCLKVDENKDCLYSKGIFADTSFFKVFDFKIAAGAKNPLQNPKSIALSESVAKKLYPNENPVGKTYLVDNHFAVTITAIYYNVPSNSSLQFDFIAPLELAYSLWGRKAENMKEYSFKTFIRADDYTSQIVEDKITKLETLEKHKNLSYFLHPLKDKHLHDNFLDGKASGGLIDYIRIIGLFALFILIMTIVNFVNLTTAQASIRGKEIGIKKVSGASRWALQVQFLFETFLKVSLAASLALLIAYISLSSLSNVIKETIPFKVDGVLSIQILLLVSITTFFSGIYPALIMSRFNPVQILKNLSFHGNGKGTARKWLTVVQISISGIIVILTAVFYLQLEFLQNENIGYDRSGIMIMEPTYTHIKNFENFKTSLTQYHQIKEVGISNTNMINANYSTDEIDWSGKSGEETVFFQMIGSDNGLIDVFDLEFISGQG
ncbi:MAG: ABC transporter permease, partial [Bacteroidota bacterium]